MKRRGAFFLFITVVFIFFSAQAFARGPYEKDRHMGKFYEHAREVMEALQLTDAQKGELHALCKGSRDKVTANWNKFEELQAGLSEKVLAATGSSKAECNKIINQIAELRAQMVKNRLEHWIKFVEILDAEQKDILSGRLKELRKRRSTQRMHMRRHFPFP